MDTNEDGPEPTSVPPVAAQADVGPQWPVDAPRPSLLRSSWSGAKTGFRLVAYIAGAVAAVTLIPSLAVTAFGVGAGRGWAVPAIGLTALGFFLVCAVWGGIIGAVIGLIVGVIRRVWPGAFRSSWWSVFHRPIHLLPRKPDAEASVVSAPPGFLRRRWRWLVGVPMLLVLLAALGTGLYLKLVVDRRLAAAIAAADRDDPFWRLDDLMAHREVVPVAENSARVLAAAIERLPENWPAGPSPPPGQPNSPPSGATKAYERLGATADNGRLDDATAAALRGELETYDEAISIARTVADYRRGRHELELGPTLIDTPLPETQASRSVARLLAADAAIRVHDGDLDGALDSCRAILGTGRSIGDEPFLISQLVRVAIGSVAMKSARRVLGQGEPSDAALARFQSLILDELTQPLLFYGLRGERATLTELIRRLGTGEVPISALSEGRPPWDPSGPRGTIAPWGKLWFDHQRAVALEWMNDAVAIARRPIVEHPALWDAWQANVDRVKQNRLGIYTATLPLLLMSALSSSSWAHSRYHCELGATAILLAAERHRRKVGDWPASIAAIDRSILPSAPVDPFSGRSFRMERRDGQLFIYSIGPNLEDEHGAYDPKKWMKGGPDDAGASAWDVSLRRSPADPARPPAARRTDGPPSRRSPRRRSLNSVQFSVFSFQ
jgi:hypothetical protein